MTQCSRLSNPRRLLYSLLIIFVFCAVQSIYAADFNGAYSESFDSMGAAGTTPPSGWSVKTGNAGSGNTTWQTSISGSGDNSVATMAAAPTPLTASSAPNAANNNGFNAQGSAASDRVLATSPTSISGAALELALTNATGSSVSALQVRYDIRRFNAPATANELPGYWLFYSLDNGSNWINVSELNPVISGSGVVVTNAVGVTTVPGSTFSLNTSWIPGSVLLLRWVDDNAAQTSPDQIIGLDNVSIAYSSAADKALFLNGVNQYATMGAATAALGASNFTLELRFKRTGPGATTSTGTGGVTAVPLATKGRGEADGSNKDCNYFLGINSSGKLVADFESLTAVGGNSAGQNYPITGNTVIIYDRWYHAAVSYDIATSTWKLYLDGVLDSALAIPAGAAPRSDSIQHFGIGTALTSTGSAAGFFQGAIDEVRVWNTVRNDSEIAANKDLAIADENLPGLLAVYGLNEGTGGSVTGMPATVPTGTLLNSPLWVDASKVPIDIALTSPKQNTSAFAPGSFYLEASAIGDIARVDFLRNGAIIGTAYSQPYAIADNGLSSGTYTYSAKATHSNGGVKISAPVAVSVSFDPNNHPSNTALLFDGVDDYATMGVAPELNAGGPPNNGLTIEAWFSKEGAGITSTSGSGGVTAAPLFGKGRGEADGSNVDCNYFFGIDASGKLVADFEAYPVSGITAGQNYPIVGANQPISNNTWHHAAATYDGATSTWKLYLDGIQVGSAVAPTGALPRYDNIQHFAIGAALNSSGVREGAFAGRIDEVRVWNYARSAAEINLAKDYEIASAYGLVGRYGFNEAFGATTANSVGSGNPTGALTNGPLWVDGAPFAGVNTAPSVTLDQPANGSSFYLPYPISLSATATDLDGSIAKVEFFVNGAKAGESGSAPFAFNWTPAASGSYNLAARAIDNLGAGAASSIATITVAPNPNRPPGIALSNPANKTMIFGSSANLEIAIADPENDALTANFYGRDGAATPGPDFSIIILPDTQFYSQNTGGNRASIFNAQTQWIVDNRATKNIAFVTHMGDITENGENNNNPVEWNNANAAMSLLENPSTTGLPNGIPYSVLPGNHDLYPGDENAGGTFYNQYFGPSRFAGRSYYGGAYNSNNKNNYQLFSASGLDFIYISLAYRSSADAAILDWADSLLKTYPNRRAIVASHWIINTGDPATFGGQGQAIYDKLKNNPNFFLMLCGHVHGEGKRSDSYQGRTVHSILTDYQNASNGGNGFLRILTFKPVNNTIHVESYSPTLNRAVNGNDGITSWTSAYDLPYNMQDTVGNWEYIGSANIPSGRTQAMVQWTGLTPSFSYEWFADVTDGINQTTPPATGLFVTSPANAQKDITPWVAINSSSFIYSRALRTYTGIVKITNSSLLAVKGPFVLWLNNLSNGVNLMNGNGSFNGYPHIDLPGPTSLAPGESINVPLTFSNPTNARINFTPTLFNAETPGD